MKLSLPWPASDIVGGCAVPGGRPRFTINQGVRAVLPSLLFESLRETSSNMFIVPSNTSHIHDIRQATKTQRLPP